MRSNPYKLRAYDRAFKLKRQLQDERDWMMGQYVFSAVATVVSNTLNKNSSMKYFEKPMLHDAIENTQDPEANEKLAVAEMEKYIAILKQQGDLPETLITDL